MAGEKTEKATPKKRDDARKKGQVGRSADLSGAVILMAGLVALSAFAPRMYASITEATRHALILISSPEVVERDGLGEVLTSVAQATLLAWIPVAVVCAVAAVLVGVVQVGVKPMPGAAKPQLKRLNPLTGAKNLYGKHMIFETLKNVAKVAVVGTIAAMAVFPKLDELAALVGMPPAVLLPQLASLCLHVAQRAAAAYILIALIDFGYQKWRNEKGLRMDMQEVKDEHKQEGLPAEVKGQQRRRAMMLANSRMMDAVPTADVVVTNPTHYSVALRYDPGAPAPVVVAKGTDHLAFRIRESAREAGVAVIPDPPLARSLYATVEVGRMIPEELFHGVAQVLAYVYRVANRKAVA
jgi:flagellar biosynthetic protein FlhB